MCILLYKFVGNFEFYKVNTEAHPGLFHYVKL